MKPANARSVMLAVFCSAAVFMLGGCDQVTHYFDDPEVKACEYFTKESLKSPSSYDRVDVYSHDEKITQDRLKELTRSPSVLGRQNEDPGIRTVGIQYDAQNGFGATIRGGMVCAFETNAGKLVDSDVSLMSHAHMSASSASLRGLVEAGAIPNVEPGELGKEREYPCCLR